MMTKIKALIGLYGIVVLSSVIQSCCNEEFRITSTGFMQAWELREDKGRDEISIVKGEFLLSAYFDVIIASNMNPSLMETSYAMSCGETFLNSIEESSVGLSLNKKFIYKEEVVLPNSNLLEIDDSGIEIHNVGYGTVEIKFSKYFIENSSFDSGEYVFSFNGMTDDNVNLENEIVLTIAIEEIQ